MLRHTEVDSQPGKTVEEKWWERIGSFIEEVKTFGLRIPTHRAAEIEVDFTEEHQIFGIRSQRALLKKARYTSQLGKERVHRKELFRIAKLKNAIRVRPNSRMEHRKKSCNKNDAPSEKHGI